MLAYVAGSVSTDLNVWERMACPCVSQAVCHSAATASVVWPLALDFIFTRCVSPCPWNFKIGCCANEKPLRLIAHRRVRFFTFMFVSTLVLGEGGELIESNSSLRKILWFWRLMTVPPQCQHDLEKTVGTFIGRSFFWRRGISFRFGQFVSLSTEAIFSFNFWEAASIVSLGEAKNGFIFEIKFWLRVWSQLLSFLEFVASNSRLACLGSDRMRAERVVAALLWFYKHDSGLFFGPANMTQKLSSACAEMILSYHLLPQQIFFTHNWNLSRHCFVVVWFFVFCVVCFCLVLFLVLFFLLFLCVSVLVLWNVTRE